MTERLYYTDCYLREFEARVVERSADGRRVYLDRTAFYPTSGGQLFDTGMLGGVRVIDVIDEGERVAHVTESPIGDAGTAAARLDWPRRFDFMQQHTGQHLLSAVFVELFGLETVSVHMGEESSTLDLNAASLEADTVRRAEWRANELVCENRPVTIAFVEAAESEGLRKASTREGTLRVVAIQDLDRSACGGTHVRSTGEIGSIGIRKLDRIRNNVRVEFLCGLRAVRRFRADYDALSGVAEVFSSPLEDAPRLAAAQVDAAKSAEKLRRKLELDLAGYQGRELYEASVPGPDGIRRAVRRLPSGSLESLRGLAQSFCAGLKAVFTGVIEDPPSVLLATSADSGVDAGAALKAALSAAGGRGGGSARMAQGSAGSREALDAVLARL
jgi:alanyl-tRNA synthetase